MQHNYTCKSESFVLFDIFLSWRNEKNHNKQKKDFLASYSPLLLLIVGNYMERWNQHPAWVWKPLSMANCNYHVGWINPPRWTRLSPPQYSMQRGLLWAQFKLGKQYHLESTGTHLSLKTSLKIKLGHLQCCDQWISI